MVNEQSITYECSFRADEKLFQIVSTRCGLEWIHLVNDGTVSHYSLESNAIGMHRSLFDELDTSCIGGKIASNLTRPLGSKIERHHVTSVLAIVLKSLEDTTSITGQDSLNWIQIVNGVHLLSGQDNFVVKRDTSPDETCVTSLRHYSEHHFVTIFEAL